jgi:hypothetical protein
MRTVFVAPDPLQQDHIDHHTNDLATFLSALA